MRFFIRFSYRPLIVKILKNPENLKKKFILSVVLVLLRNALVDPGEEPEPMRFFIKFSYRPLIVKILKNRENLKKNSG